jgi:hypothetical protein
MRIGQAEHFTDFTDITETQLLAPLLPHLMIECDVGSGLVCTKEDFPPNVTDVTSHQMIHLICELTVKVSSLALKDHSFSNLRCGGLTAAPQEAY